MSMMNSSQALYSTPVFELFRRGLTVQTVKNFRGINVFQNVTLLSAEHALDCMNILIPGTGGISKFRLPVQLSDIPVGLPPAGPYQIFDFQKVDGTRQVVGTFGQSLYYYTWVTDTQLSAGTLIDNAAADAQPWSMVEANQTLYAANGVQMRKWTGANWYSWGIAAPTTVPTIGSLPRQILSIQRTANVVTFTIENDVVSGGAAYLQVGDMVTVVNPPDVSFNGTFAIASVVTPGLKYTYAQVGINTVAYANVATVQFPTSSGIVPGIVVGSRTAGVATYSWAPQLDVDPVAIVGTEVTISGFADASLNGTFEVATATQLFTGTTAVTVTQPGLPDSAGGINGTLTLGVNITNSRTYAISFVTNLGTPSNIGPTTVLNGPITNRIVYVQGTLNPLPDAQIASQQLFATLDGGGDLFIDRCATGIPLVYLRDFLSEADLDPTVQAPLIHNVPPVGKYLTVGQSRIFIANLVGDSTAIAYSGYEQIVYPGARPEECFPPSNRLRLQIGAEGVAGIGVLQTGVVAFSTTKKMYMLRGNVEDIVVTAPVAFSAFLEELPWNIGTMCHQSIQPTPYGLIFWASDRTVQLFNGMSALSDISGPVYPILRRATKGFESAASSAYFNWLERDWYGLSFPIDGSHTNNFTLFWSLAKDTMQVDIFPCSIGMDCLSTITSSSLQRILAAGQLGKIMNLPVSQDTIGGMADVTVIPATNAKLAAWWRGGYFGNDSPYRHKMVRRGLAVTDTDGFSVTVRTVNNTTHKVTNPKILNKKRMNSNGGFGINDRCARVSVEINFPDQDVSCNVLELSVGWIPTSDRL